MKIQRTELKDAVAGLSKIVSPRAHLPALAHVRLDGDGQAVRLTGTDLDQVASYEIAAAVPVSQPMSVLIPFDALQSIIKTAQGDGVEIDRDSNAVALGCTVAGQNIVRRVSTLALEEWPSLPTPAVTKSVGQDFLKQVRQAIPFTSTDETRPILNSVYLDVKGKDHRIVATDGRRLTVLSCAELPLSESVIVPVTKFLGWTKLVGDTCVGATKDMFTLRCGPWTYNVKPVDGQYPNYGQVIPDYDDAGTLELSPEDADMLVKALPSLPKGNDRDNAVMLRLDTHTMRVCCRPDATSPETTIRLESSSYTGNGAFSISVNRDYFRDALLAGFRFWKLQDAASPLLGRLTPDYKGSVHVLMPIRTSEPHVQHAKAPVAQPVPTPVPVAIMNPKEIPTMPKSVVEPATTPEPGALDKLLVAYEAAKAAVRQAQAALADVALCVRDAIREDKVRSREVAEVRAGLAKLQAIRV